MHFFLFQQPNWRNQINFQTLKLFYFGEYFFKNWYLLILLKLYFILFRNPSQFLKSYFKRKINSIKILFSSSLSSPQSHAGEVSYNIKILSNLYLFVNIFFLCKYISRVQLSTGFIGLKYFGIFIFCIFCYFYNCII